MRLAPTQGPTDAELVLSARAGDRRAQELIFRRHVGAVARIAERLLRRRDEADDVVQDTFASALTSLDSLRDPASLRSWLLGIAVVRVKRRHRRRSFLRVLGLDRGVDDATFATLAAPGIDPEESAELGLVDDALQGVDADCRAAWVLRNVEGERLEAVAAITGCSLATVKRRIAKVDEVVAAHTGRRT